MNKKAFTLIEILVAVLIIGVLVTMAVPMYERTIEKSRFSEASVLLKRLADSKARTMDSMGLTTFTSGSFTMNNLDSEFPTNADFSFSIVPSSYPNAVCAKRLRGNNAGVVLLYLGELGGEACAGKATSICSEFNATGTRLFCGPSTKSAECGIYGMNATDVGSC